MKKTFLAIVAALMLCVVASTAMAGKAYSTFNNAQKTLYFKYTTGTVPSNTPYYQNLGEGSWNNSYADACAGYADKIEYVVFDPSFKDARPDYVRKWFKGLKNLKSITGWQYITTSDSKVNCCTEMFMGCESLQNLGDFQKFDISHVKECDKMFYGCKSLVYVDFADMNISKVTTFESAFEDCTHLRKVDFRGCSTSNLKNTKKMFAGCNNLETLFVGCGWSVDNVTQANSKSMFDGCWRIKGSKSFDSGITDYRGATIEYYIVKDCSGDFTAKAYAQLYGNTLTFYYDKYKSVYETTFALNSGEKLPKWNEYKNDIKTVVFDKNFEKYTPKTCFKWFYGCQNLTSVQNLNNLDLTYCTSTSYMFSGCKALKSIDLSDVYLTNIPDFSYMFYNCEQLASISLPNNTLLATNISMEGMFKGCSSLTSLDFINTINTKNVTDMSYMFSATGITEVPENLSLNLSGCKDMSWMFSNCSTLQIVYLAQNTDVNPTITKSMFYNCNKLNYITLGNNTHIFNMNSVTDLTSMFNYCNKLKAIFVKSDWNLPSNASSTDCFHLCYLLTGCNGTTYTHNSNIVDATLARIDKDGQKGYLSTYQSYYSLTDNGKTKSYTYTANEKVSIANPTRNGYVFEGWTGTGLSEKTKNLTISKYSSGKHEYTANWLIDLTSSYTNITITLSSNTYDGTAKTYTISDGDKILKEGTDYIITEQNGPFLNAKNYHIDIKGIGQYTGEKTLTFTVDKATVTITPKPTSKTYGEATDPAIEYTVDGLVGNEKLTKEPTFDRESGNNAGNYNIWLKYYGTASSNYDVKYNTNSIYFTINPKPVTVTPKAHSKTYGEADPPEFEYTVNGLINDDQLTGTLGRQVGENAGEYPYTDKFTNKNYSVTISGNAKFIILPKTVNTPIINFNSGIYVYNGSEVKPQLTLLDGATPIPASEYTVSYSNNNAPGTGQVTITDNPGGNYNVSCIATFTILNPTEAWKATVVSSGLGEQTIDREVFVAKGQALSAEMLAVEGYTLKGVYSDAEHNTEYTYPALSSNITIYAQYQINKHTITFKVDGEVFSTQEYNYNSEISYPDMTKEGYTFSGWDSEPTVMPDCDITLSGSYAINSYKLVYLLDGKEYYSETIEYGKSITPQPNPASKTGYNFSGWSTIPSKMPSHDVEITGSFVPHKHTVTFLTNDEVFSVESFYNTKISSILPEKPGLRFVPKADSPTKVPDYDITIEGTFEVRTYAIKYVVDYNVYKTVDLYLGDPITVIAAPTKTGYTFSGWSEAPATMPAKDIEITGKFTANQHTVTYYIDGEVFKTVTLSYGSRIYPPSAPYKAGLRFAGWGDIPETMPDNDLEIRGTFSSATPVAEVAEEGNGAKVWSYNRTIYIETAPDTKYTIIDLNGRILTTSTTKSSHDEIQISQTGVLIVIINNHSFKLFN